MTDSAKSHGLHRPDRCQELIYRDCFPRTERPAPGVELTYVEQNDAACVIAPALRNLQSNHEEIRHSINLLLEFFGECELVKVDLSRFAEIKMNRLNWKLLPPGEYPWERLKSHLKEALKRSSENTQAVIFDRQETIMSFKPDEQFIGSGGFSDYIAYVFRARGIVVLESIRRGNAIYVFGLDWEHFSKLSKSDVINADLHLARLIHSKGWKENLSLLMDQRYAAE